MNKKADCREEFVNFYHQDASGASLRLSDKLGSIAAGDSSEYDALGNNVGLSNPYETGYEPPPPDGELNTGFGDVSYRGGGGSPIPATYLVNGLRVSASEFAMWADTASIGGMFGILERNARMSAPRYTVFDVYGLPVYSGTDWGQARQNAFQTETLFVYSVTYESWSLNLSLFSFTERPQAQQQNRTVNIKEVTVNVNTYPHKKQLESDFKSRLSVKCKDALDKLTKKLGYDKGIESLYNDVIKAGDLLMASQPFPQSIAAEAWTVGDEIIFNNRSNYNVFSDSTTLIHELLHVAAGGSNKHTNIANAMFQLSIKLGDTPISFTKQNLKINNNQPVTFTEPANNKNRKGFDKENVNSDYMNKWINTYCPK